MLGSQLTHVADLGVEEGDELLVEARLDDLLPVGERAVASHLGVETNPIPGGSGKGKISRIRFPADRVRGTFQKQVFFGEFEYT